MIRRIAVCAAFLFAAPSAVALELELPAGARPLADRVSPLSSYALPIGPFSEGDVPVKRFEGRVERQTWRLDAATVTTLQLLAPLRAQIADAGYEVIYECRDRACGGFDFRFYIEVVPAPDMHVDIRDYRFLAATRGDSEALSLLVSRSRNSAYVQLIRTGATLTTPLKVEAQHVPLPVAGAEKPGRLAQALMASGHVVLHGLEFDTGAATLGAGPHASLEELVAFLNDNPELIIALVGHTDSQGDLDRNISLSKRRAEAVRDILVEEFGIAPARIAAEGVGYLAPVASNLTAEGREANRRVEAIFLQGP